MSGFFDYQLLEHSLIVGTLLFALGLVGFIARRNAAAMIISAGVMLQAAMLAFTAFGSFHGTWSGQVVSLLVLLATLAMGGVVATVLVALARSEGSLDTDRLRSLGNEAANDESPLLPHNLNAPTVSSPSSSGHSEL